MSEIRIHREHDRVGRRIYIKAHHGLEPLGQQRIAGRVDDVGFVAASSLTPTVEVRQVARATRVLMRAKPKNANANISVASLVQPKRPACVRAPVSQAPWNFYRTRR
jgi:hypothetical protein